MKLKPKFISAALAVLLTTISIPYNMFINTAEAAEFNVCVNEVCTQNKMCLKDSYGNYSDWIELYNAGNSEEGKHNG